MNKSKLRDRRYWEKVRSAGGVGRIPRWISSCYLVAFVRRDGALERVGTFSEDSPTCTGHVVPVAVDRWQAGEPYGNASRAAVKAMRRGRYSWAWPWVDPSRAAYEARLDLQVRARAGELTPPGDVALKAAELWRRRDA